MPRPSLLAAAVVAVMLLVAVAPAFGQDEEPNLEFFYPLIAHRPVIERELELRLRHERGSDHRRTEVSGAVEAPILPRWQVELEVPLIVQSPEDGPLTAGVGDVSLENKVLLWKSIEHRALLAAGVEVTFPTGSERRELGGEAAIEPFVTGAIALGRFDVIADVAAEFNVNAHVKGEQEQELETGVGVGYWLTPRFAPLLELTTVSQLRGPEMEAESGHPSLRGRTQVYLTPGLNWRPLPRTTFRFGVQLPVTDAREFDYAIHAGFVFEF